MFNVQMRKFKGEEPIKSVGDNIVIKCGLGKTSSTFNEKYTISSAGKFSTLINNICTAYNYIFLRIRQVCAWLLFAYFLCGYDWPTSGNGAENVIDSGRFHGLDRSDI